MAKAKDDFPPPRFRPMRCAVCERCVYDVLTGRCIYGGPYNGWAI